MSDELSKDVSSKLGADKEHRKSGRLTVESSDSPGTSPLSTKHVSESFRKRMLSDVSGILKGTQNVSSRYVSLQNISVTKYFMHRTSSPQTVSSYTTFAVRHCFNEFLKA